MKLNLTKLLLSSLIFVEILAIFYFIIRAFVTDTERIFYFSVCLLITITFTLITIKIRLKNIELQKNFLIFFFSSMTSLYLLEIALFKINDNKSNFQFNENMRAAKILQKKFDKRSVYEFYKDLKRKDAVISMSRTKISLDNQEIQTLGGIGNAFTVLCNEAGSWITYKSDRFGFNNPDNLWDEELDVIIIGDSYGLGLCVEQDENFAGVMIKKGKKALTLGGTGMGPLFEYAIYREYAQRLKAKNLVTLFLLNDFDNMNSELKNPILNKYLNDDSFNQSLATRQIEIDHKLREKLIKHIKEKKPLLLKRIIKFHHTRDIIKNLSKKKEQMLMNNFNLDEKKLNKVINIYKKIENDFDGNFYIGFIPTASEYMYDEKEKKILKNIADEVIYNFEKNNFRVIDFRKKLDLENLSKIIPFGNIVKAENHFTSYGFKIISEQILKNTN